MSFKERKIKIFAVLVAKRLNIQRNIRQKNRENDNIDKLHVFEGVIRVF